MMSSGTTLKTRPSLLRRAAEVVVERRQLHAVVDGVADEPVRAGADRDASRKSTVRRRRARSAG